MDGFPLIYPGFDDGGVWDDAGYWSEDAASLLPPSNTGAAEYALEQVSARIEDFRDTIRPLWSVEDCPEALLEQLAWALSVDEWEPDWTEASRREVVRRSVTIHRKKGTIGAIRRALIASGYGDAEIIEGARTQFYNGAAPHSGADTYSALDHWAKYRVNLFQPITNRQANSVRRILRAAAPLRCELVALNFTAAPFSYDAAIRHNGAANYGVS